MRQRTLLFVLALWAVLGLAVVQAQAAQYQQSNQTGTAKEMSLTGCLAKGAEANQYQLTTANGKIYNLAPEANINLADHVGHKVKITGMRENAQTGGTQAGTAPAQEQFRVTNIKHISKTCP